MAHNHAAQALSTAALDVRDLGFDYGEKVALDKVTLSIKAGELVILLGPNGAGKTTLFSLICGLFAPARGSISINGSSLMNRSEALAPLGIVFQSQTLDVDLSVQQNLLYFCDLHGLERKTARSRIEAALRRMDLHTRAHDKVRTLNGGHRRRVEIIRATLHEPSILLLDEPTVGLDIPTRAELLDYVRELPESQGCAVLWATHLIDEIHDTDRVALLHAGKKHHDGIAQQLVASHQVADLPALMSSLNTAIGHDKISNKCKIGANRQMNIHRRYLSSFTGIVKRELLRFVHQRERFLAALVRPLLWLIVFAAGFRAALGLAIIPPYQTYISYEVYIVPGLIGMIQLFNGMQSSLSMVYDQEMGSMRVLLTAPLPRWYLLLCKLLAGVLVSIMQIATFLITARIAGIDFAYGGVLLALPVMILSGIMLGSLGLLISSVVRQLENFAGVMNFVIFPLFFMSSALYPIWKMRESSDLLARICEFNPFTHAIEAIRFAFYGQFNALSMGVLVACTLVFFGIACWSYDPARRFRAGRTASA